MPISTSAECARMSERVQMVNDRPYRLRGYVGMQPDTGREGYGTGQVRDMEPQGFLVFQPPNAVTRPHFHQTNQFQIFVGGSGTVGRLRADPLTIQFAGPNTTYGPIVSEDEGIRYFTLRQSWDPGAQYMPEKRAKLVKGEKRQFVAVRGQGEVPPVTDSDGVQTETLIAPQSDGLSALVFTIPSGAEIALPDAISGGGQYQVVIAGSQIRDDEYLDELSVEFAFPDEGCVPVRAGANGLELLVLRFPT